MDYKDLGGNMSFLKKPLIQNSGMNANLIHKWLRDPRFATDFLDDVLEIDEVPAFLPVEIEGVVSSPATRLPMSPSVSDARLNLFHNRSIF